MSVDAIDAVRSIKLDVAYFNDHHKSLLAKTAFAKQIESLVLGGASIPIEEFLTHFLFHRVKSSPQQYGGYQAVRTRIADTYGMLGDLVTISGDTLAAAPNVKALPPYLIENVGESVALSVMNRIHGLTEADWLPIAVQPGRKGRKTLDYEYGSSGSEKVQVEAKGVFSGAKDPRSQSATSQATDIEAKKAAQPATDRALRYGVITIVPSWPKRPLALLLDPPPEADERTSRDLQLISRLHFLRWLFWVVSPRSNIASALATRIRALEELPDIDVLSHVPLMQPNAEKMYFETVRLSSGREYSRFFGSKSKIADGPGGGVVAPLPSRDLFFVGFRNELLEVAANQDFDVIRAYKAEQYSTLKTVECMVPNSEFEKFGLSSELVPAPEKLGSYVRFELRGLLRYSSDGLIFGRLPVSGAEARART